MGRGGGAKALAALCLADSERKKRWLSAQRSASKRTTALRAGRKFCTRLHPKSMGEFTLCFRAAWRTGGRNERDLTIGQSVSESREMCRAGPSGVRCTNRPEGSELIGMAFLLR